MNPAALTTLHIHSEDVPWVGFTGNTKVRILHARPSEELIVTQIQAPPLEQSELHRHLGPVFGWTVSGRWGHDKSCEYRPGTYIFETPGVIHRFHSGNEPVDAIYVSYGKMERLDDETHEVYQTLTPELIFHGYMQACESAGLPRPNVLA